MALLITLLLFVVVAVLISLLGMRLWVRPKEAMERVTGSIVDSHEHIPVHPSLAFHEIIQKLGKILPLSPKDASVMQKRLIRAGFRGPDALKILYGSKVAFVILCPVLMTFAVSGSQSDPSNKLMAVLAAAAAGFFGPNEYVKVMARRRQKEIRRGLPNALDLMVVCVESGLGLDQAILQVAKDSSTRTRKSARSMRWSTWN
jgi:Flp pilus assembly protein TadC